jgi:hypothetical protein
MNYSYFYSRDGGSRFLIDICIKLHCIASEKTIIIIHSPPYPNIGILLVRLGIFQQKLNFQHTKFKRDKKVTSEQIIDNIACFGSFKLQQTYAKFLCISATSGRENVIYIHSGNSLSLHHTACSKLHPSSDGTSSEGVNIRHHPDLKSQATRIPDFSG